ncbi:hypothetical protein GUJ93_ZPchr0013g36842 [Zizania palustris]|nr:hypothetical protein GUJ93_ZPchr0013g36842 [Zizania palustris]
MKRNRSLSCQCWNGLFPVNGKLRDGGKKFLKEVCSKGIGPDIRARVWLFLLGVCCQMRRRGRSTINTVRRGLRVQLDCWRLSWGEMRFKSAVGLLEAQLEFIRRAIHLVFLKHSLEQAWVAFLVWTRTHLGQSY